MISRRSEKAIWQYARAHGLADRTGEVLRMLNDILPQLGEQSHGRQMVNRIGKLLHQDFVGVVAPSCPDYSHDGGVYTFKSVGAGVPLLAERHISFLSALHVCVPHMRCELVLADQESEDPVLCARMGSSQKEMALLVRESAIVTQKRVASFGWKVSLMTQRFPGLKNHEKRFAAQIEADAKLRFRINTDAIARSGMYQRIGVYGGDAMRRRTVRTAAQYCALGHIAASEGFLICNHDTVNLGWFAIQDAAVLHNPVQVY